MEGDEELRRQLCEQVIRKDKWWDLLSRFIDVLRINLFVVDYNGRMVLPPEPQKYGGKLLLEKALRFDCLEKLADIPKHFVRQGSFWEARHRYDLTVYAIPIEVRKQTIAYVVAGPVRWHKAGGRQIEAWAEALEVDTAALTGELNELRVVSHVMINSILDLLAEMIHNHVELTLRELKNGEPHLEEEPAAWEEAALGNVADEIYSDVRLDELLVTLLDVALKMTETEAGSIMVLDETDQSLTIKVSKGLASRYAQKGRTKLGEGIAGIAAAEKKPFLIEGQKGDSRIQHLLKRPGIKKSLVMPLEVRDRIFGVLNLHTNKAADRITDNLDNLQYLTRLLSSAF